MSAGFSGSQSMSKNFDAGACGPKASVSCQYALPGPTPAWFGTQSSTIWSPRAAHAAASRSNPSRPPSASLTRLWSTTSYPCVDPSLAAVIGER